MTGQDRRWNHNTHYYPLVLAAVPDGCGRALDLAAVVANLGYRAARGYWDHPSPVVWPPPHTYREIRALAGDLLPGVRYRRHLLWRYSLTWTKPVS